MRRSSPLALARHAVEVARRRGIGALAAKVARTLSIGGIAYRLRRRREDAAFDRRFGTRTGGVDHIHTLDTLGEHGAAGTDHFASPRDEFEAALRLVGRDFLAIPGLTFVDLGSGKGRALMLAAERDFAAIVGVEFARSLVEVAAANLAARAAALGADDRITLLHADATGFAYPEAPLLLYLFNPFGPPAIDLVAERALAAWARSPRPWRIVYVNALHPGSFTAAGWRLLVHERGTAVFAPPVRGTAVFAPPER